MRIAADALLLGPPPYAGVHVAIRGSLKAIAAALADGDDMLVYARRDVGADELPPASERVRIHRPLWPVGRRTGRILWEQFRLPRRLFSDSADVLHCPGYVMPRMALKPCVATVHDIFALVRPELCRAANRSHFSRMLPITLARARRVVVPTEAVRHDILRWNDGLIGADLRAKADAPGQPLAQRKPIADLAGRLRVIPWGVDARFRPFADDGERAAFVAAHGLPEPFVMIAARPEPKKNLATALRAWFAATVSKRLPHRLVMAGPRGWGVERSLERLIAELGLGDRVARPGFLADDDLARWMAAAAAVLVPSWTEGFGLPAVEAMAAGVPVIAAHVPALAEVVGDAGVLVRPDDLSGWREAIARVLSVPDYARQRAAAGLRRARSFTWAAHAEQMLAVFHDVVEEDRRRGDDMDESGRPTP